MHRSEKQTANIATRSPTAAGSSPPDPDVIVRQSLKPILRWVGGKQSLARVLCEHVPNDLSSCKYFEPFLGAASLYLRVRPADAQLSDLNPDLISMYEYVRDRPSLVSRYLAMHAKNDSEPYYYATRDRFNASTWYSAADAARFIYLNRTCFNGIYRVNKQGQFNVPYGYKESPLFPSPAELRILSKALRTANLACTDFEDALIDAERGDFVYLDPPYPALNGTSYFTHYTCDRFNTDDQEVLAEVVDNLDERGCLVMMSNADTNTVRRLYKGMSFHRIEVPRYVTSKKKKHKVSELVIKNY